jgi:predicted DNA-binding transcriptional regulator AlpA
MKTNSDLPCNDETEAKSPAIELLDLPQVAARYNVTIRSIQAWTKRNEGFPQPLRFSRRIVRWRLTDLQRFEAGEK